MAVLTGLAFLASAGIYGGWYWALMGAAALAVLWRVDLTMQSVLFTIGVSIFWLALFHWSGDRRLFFPYSMQFAAQVACLLRGRNARPNILGGGGMVAVFTAIRIVQEATVKVLAVELIVAAIVLAIATSVYRLGLSNTGLSNLALSNIGLSDRVNQVRTIAGTVASVLAFAGLIF